MKLNLGCGEDIREGYINIDYHSFEGVDKIFNLNHIPYPFEDSSITEIIMQNILEHLDNPFQVMKEIYRICKNKAIIKIRIPHFSSCNCWGDIEHKRGFNYSTFQGENIQKYFRIIHRKITFSHWKFFMRPLVKLFPYFYEKHFAYIFNAVDLNIELEKKSNSGGKGKRLWE